MTQAQLVLGPLLRYAGETEATIWVETDRACQVEVLGHQAQTFEVYGHHYALVMIDGLQPGSEHEYRVALDGVVRWPSPDSEFGPSVLRTLDPDRPLRLVFGSCRIAELPPLSRRQRRAPAEHGPDALSARAMDLRGQPPGSWPDVLLLIGDQVYADEVGPATRQFIEQRRDPSKPPGYQVADFTEYCFLYHEAWTEPSVRWLLSVIPSAMIFDDHDVHDDWNISSAWLREYQAKPWWQARMQGAYASYWIYQHLGNLSPAELAKDEVWRQVRQGGDATPVLRDFAARTLEQPGDSHWSFQRTFGNVRVVVIDSRGARVLDGERLMISEAEWRWVTESVSGDWDHLVLATSLPLLLPRGIHDLEAWNEAVSGGAWGRRLARLGERMRQAADLEHWAAFGRSFADFERLLSGLASGAHGRPPASVTVISGDIHHSYLAAVDLPGQSAVYQAVCSPIHNMMPDRFRRAQQLIASRPGELASHALARLAGVKGPRFRWRITEGPWFFNMLCALEFAGRKARLRLDRAVQDADQPPTLRLVCETDLS
jgi:PhoD-like phosphatase